MENKSNECCETNFYAAQALEGETSLRLSDVKRIEIKDFHLNNQAFDPEDLLVERIMK